MEGALVVLALLVCPIGMGLMMWFMAKGMKRHSEPDAPARGRSDVETLREEHARLGSEIDRLEGASPDGRREVSSVRR